MRGLEQGRYTATYVRSGKVLDLNAGNKVGLTAHDFHGLENQQARAFGSPFCSELIVVVIHDRPTSPRGACNIHSDCSGSSVRAVRVSSSTAPGLARSSQLGTPDKELWKSSRGPSRRAGSWRHWIIGMWGAAPSMKTETCMSGTYKGPMVYAVLRIAIVNFSSLRF